MWPFIFLALSMLAAVVFGCVCIVELRERERKGIEKDRT